jgi:hypothetical protein
MTKRLPRMTNADAVTWDAASLEVVSQLQDCHSRIEVVKHGAETRGRYACYRRHKIALIFHVYSTGRATSTMYLLVWNCVQVLFSYIDGTLSHPYVCSVSCTTTGTGGVLEYQLLVLPYSIEEFIQRQFK